MNNIAYILCFLIFISCNSNEPKILKNMIPYKETRNLSFLSDWENISYPNSFPLSMIYDSCSQKKEIKLIDFILKNEIIGDRSIVIRFAEGWLRYYLRPVPDDIFGDSITYEEIEYCPTYIFAYLIDNKKDSINIYSINRDYEIEHFTIARNDNIDNIISSISDYQETYHIDHGIRDSYNYTIIHYWDRFTANYHVFRGISLIMDCNSSSKLNDSLINTKRYKNKEMPSKYLRDLYCLFKRNIN
jgi:hypothetical protein